jgi:hypothetical protein
MNVLAIDPGPTESAFVLYDGERILDHGHWSNMALRNRLKQRNFGLGYMTVIEQVSMGGMIAGAEIFETCFWSGRFAEASRPFDRVKRTTVKRHLCGKTNSNDRAVREALTVRFGGGFPAGFTGHRFAALAVAVTWMDQQLKEAGTLWASSDCSTSIKSVSS